MSLYEASDIIPGQSFWARDLVRGGEPVLVSERSATKALKTWDRIAARIVEHNGKMTMAGGLLPFTLEASEGLFSQLRNCSPDAATKRPGGASKAGALNGWRGSDDDLRRAAPLFTSAWLFDVLPRALRTDPPKLFNSDGDEIPSAETDARTRSYHYLYLPHHLFEAEERKRLDAVLGDLVGSPLTEIQTVEQLKAAPRRRPDEAAAAIPSEVQEELVHEALDKHYRASLDEPTPMLGNVSPRAAARTAKGREDLVVWLKHLKNQSHHAPDRNSRAG